MQVPALSARAHSLVGWTSGPQVTWVQQEQDPEQVTWVQQEQDPEHRSCCSGRRHGPGGRPELRTDSHLSLFLILTYLLTENFAFIILGRVIK